MKRSASGAMSGAERELKRRLRASLFPQKAAKLREKDAKRKRSKATGCLDIGSAAKRLGMTEAVEAAREARMEAAKMLATQRWRNAAMTQQRCLPRAEPEAYVSLLHAAAATAAEAAAKQKATEKAQALELLQELANEKGLQQLFFSTEDVHNLHKSLKVVDILRRYLYLVGRLEPHVELYFREDDPLMNSMPVNPLMYAMERVTHMHD